MNELIAQYDVFNIIVNILFPIFLLTGSYLLVNSIFFLTRPDITSDGSTSYEVHKTIAKRHLVLTGIYIVGVITIFFMPLIVLLVHPYHLAWLHKKTKNQNRIALRRFKYGSYVLFVIILIVTVIFLSQGSYSITINN